METIFIVILIIIIGGIWACLSIKLHAWWEIQHQKQKRLYEEKRRLTNDNSSDVK